MLILKYLKMDSLYSRLTRAAFEKGYRVNEDGNVTGPRGHLLSLYGSTYLRFSVKIDECKTSRSLKVHRLAAYQKFGEKSFDSSLEVRHLDGDRKNNSLSNIDIGTPSQNQLDRCKELRVAQAKYASSFAGQHPEEIVQLVLSQHKNGISGYRIAKNLNLPLSTVGCLIRRHKTIH